MFGARSIGAVAVLALALCALLPAPASAAEGDGEGAATIFSMRASHGYRLIVVGHADRDDGRGEVTIGLLGKGRHSSVSYTAKGYVTDSRLRASFGALGGMDLVLRHSGKTGKYRAGGACHGKSESYEKASYRGIFEFRGEEGFTYARATRIPVSPQPWVDLLCSYYLQVDTHGLKGKQAGAVLTARMKRGERSGVELQVAKNRPGGRALVTASVVEKRHGIAISRQVQRFAGAGAFDYVGSLSRAAVDLPAPFSGSAVFRGDARGARRWTGDLHVDMPGRAGVSLTRPGLRTTLVPAHWSYQGPEFE